MQWLTRANLPGQSGDAGQITLGQSDYMTFVVDLSGLPAGEYTGFLRAQDTQAAGSSAVLVISLNVAQPAATLVVPTDTLFFSAEAGAATTTTRTLRVTSTSAPVTARATPRTRSGSWLTVNGSTSPVDVQTPADFVIGVNTAGLSPGLQYGSIVFEPGGYSVSVELTITESARPSISGTGVERRQLRTRNQSEWMGNHPGREPCA